jgi:hypothetical protein
MTTHKRFAIICMQSIIVSLLVVASCTKKSTRKTPEGIWRCSGTEDNKYYYDSTVRVWNGSDSLSTSVYVFSDSLIEIKNKSIQISSIDHSRLAISSLAYDGEWSYLAIDTITYVSQSTNVRMFSVKHLSSRNQTYSIDLSYDLNEDKVHIVYDWSVIGPNYNDVGSTVKLDGVRN